MAIDADHDDVLQRRGPFVHVDGFRDIDAELGFFHPRRDIRVGLRVDIGIDAQADGRLLADAGGDLVKRNQLRLGFNVEHQDAGIECVLDLFLFLAHAGKNDLFRIGAHFQRAKQFAAGHDVEAAPLLGKRAQERQVRVGLHGKTNDVADLREGAVEDLIVAPKRRQAVNVSRRANLFGNTLERHTLGVHFPVAVFEMMHYGPRTISTSLEGSLSEPSFN